MDLRMLGLLGIVGVICVLASALCLWLAQRAAEVDYQNIEAHRRELERQERLDQFRRRAAAAREIAALSIPRKTVVYDPTSRRWTDLVTGASCSEIDLRDSMGPDPAKPRPKPVSELIVPKSTAQDAPGTTIVDALDLGYPLK